MTPAGKRGCCHEWVCQRPVRDLSCLSVLAAACSLPCGFVPFLWAGDLVWIQLWERRRVGRLRKYVLAKVSSPPDWHGQVLFPPLKPPIMSPECMWSVWTPPPVAPECVFCRLSCLPRVWGLCQFAVVKLPKCLEETHNTYDRSTNNSSMQHRSRSNSRDGHSSTHDTLFWKVEVGLGILQITSVKRCLQVWPWFDRPIFSTNFVEFDLAV